MRPRMALWWYLQRLYNIVPMALNYNSSVPITVFPLICWCTTTSWSCDRQAIWDSDSPLHCMSRVTTPFTSTCGLQSNFHLVLWQWMQRQRCCLILMSRISNILSEAYQINLKEMGRINLEVCACAVTTCTRHNAHRVWQEQRKAALRKVELELDEADDIVQFFSSCQCTQNLILTVLF